VGRWRGVRVPSSDSATLYVYDLSRAALATAHVRGIRLTLPFPFATIRRQSIFGPFGAARRWP